VPCKDHHIVLTHAIGEAHAYGCPFDVMDSSLLDTRFSEYLVELPS
jgi:hypothetical protein